MGLDVDICNGIRKAVFEKIPILAQFQTVAESVQQGTILRKNEEWKDMVEQHLVTLEDIVLSSIGTNELFSNVLIMSSELARKSNNEKMQYLACGVSNSAITELSEDVIIIFLNCIAKYTSLHFKMLKYFDSPQIYAKSEPCYGIPSSMSSFFYEWCPDFDKNLENIIVRDLHDDGLFDINSINVVVSANGCFDKHTTELGSSFIKFFGI